MLSLFALTFFCFFFVGVDAKYRIQERPSSLLSRETESLLERRNSKCACSVIELRSTKYMQKQITVVFMH